MKRASQEDFAALGGLAWADAKHDICLPATGTERRELLMREQRPEAIAAWVHTLRTRFNGQPVAVGLALHTGPIVSALRQEECLVLVPVNPLPLATSREAFTPSRAKDDPPEAALQGAFLLTHRDKRTPLPPQSPTMRALAQLVEHRRRVVGDNVRLPNRLTRARKNYFPHVLQWFPDKETGRLCDFLSRWPTLNAAPLARRTTLEAFVRAQQVRTAEVIDSRLQAIKSALALTTDAGVITPHVLLGHALIAPLRVPWQAIADCDTAIAQGAHTHPDFPLFAALPGAGAVCAPRLLVACGAQRERVPSAEDLQKYAGIAPVTARRGKTSWGHWRWQWPTCLRQTCVEGAAESIRHACWAQVYDQHQRAKGKAHQAAGRALAFQWRRILSRCWQARTPYDESVSLPALKRRNAPLLHNLANLS